MDNFKGGLIPQKKDERNIKVGAIFDLPPLSELPKEFILKPLEIKKQKRPDGCAGCAVASIKELQEGIILDENFAFLAGKAVSDYPDSWGLTLKEALKGSVEFGVPDKQIVETMKNENANTLDEYSELCLIEASRNRSNSYMEVKDMSDTDVFDDIKRTIWYFRKQKRGVIIGINWDYNLKDIYLKDIKDKGVGHALTIIGFTEKDNVPYLVAQNSFGRDVGDKGLHYISREVINSCVNKYGGAFTLVDMEREEAEEYIREKIKYSRNPLNKIFRIKIIKGLIDLFKTLMRNVEEKERIEQLEIDLKDTSYEEIKEEIKIKTMSEKLYELAVKYLGTDASPRDFAPDNLACAESVSNLLKELFGDFPIITGTYSLREKLSTDKRFKRVTEPERGCIIMSATGTSKFGKNTPIKNGHVGIIGDNGKTYSNDRKNGKFSDHITLDYWKSYLGKQGGYPIEYYKLID